MVKWLFGSTKAYYVVVISLTILLINERCTNHYLNYGEDSLSADQKIKRIHSKRALSKTVNDLHVVINTPKMGTDGLTKTMVSKGCKETKINVSELKRFDCQRGHKKQVLRTHKFDIGSEAIERHRNGNSKGRCLIVTAVRSPATWFQSYFLQTLGPQKYVKSLGGCNLDDWPSSEELLEDFRDFLHKKSSAYGALTLAIPGLLNEFGGGSLREQFEIMDRNGGYSELGPAPPESIMAGCNLLFLRMEQSDRWPAIFDQIDPTIKFEKGLARVDRCPNLANRIKVVQDYSMTIAEKNFIYQRGDRYIKDWFDAYGFNYQRGSGYGKEWFDAYGSRNKTVLNDEVFA